MTDGLGTRAEGFVENGNLIVKSSNNMFLNMTVFDKKGNLFQNGTGSKGRFPVCSANLTLDDMEDTIWFYRK